MGGRIEKGAILAERYRVGRLLGAGGVGSVYEATDVVKGERVALKLIRPELAKQESTRRRLLREARLAAKVEHPSVVDIYDVGVHKTAIFLVMELLQGESLGDWLRARGPAPAGVLVPLMMPALRGVAALHEAGVIHRDLKPDNIFLCQVEEGLPRAKVLDFGLSKATDPTTPKLTDTGTLLGTPAYMAPEQLQGEHEIDHRADIYALGVVLYEGLSGARPFVADNIPALVGKVLFEDPEPLALASPSVSEELSAVVMRAMARDREARFEHIDALIDALTGLSIEGSSVPSRPSLPVATEPPPSAAQRGSRPLLWLLGVALALVLVGLMVAPLLMRGGGHR